MPTMGKTELPSLPDTNSFPGVPSQCIIQTAVTEKPGTFTEATQLKRTAAEGEENALARREASRRLKWMLFLPFQPAQWHCLG